MLHIHGKGTKLLNHLNRNHKTIINKYKANLDKHILELFSNKI
jgi:hypothetical protein